MSVTLCINAGEENEFTRLVAESQLSKRLSLVPYHLPLNASYPINLLRNLAIDNSKTNHFWLTDLDMWPSDGLYDAILTLPAEDLRDPKLAIIVPAFEIRSPKCETFRECTNSVLDIFPNTKQALRRCTQRRKCGRFRPFDRLHDYFFMRWYSLAYNDLLTPVTCFKSDTQEPYVVVRKSPDLPRFDERFVNYAYNKVQWIEHLRYRGYRFSVLTMGFAVDMPHPFSPLRAQFMEVRKATNSTLNKNLFNQFRTELAAMEKNRSVVTFCIPPPKRLRVKPIPRAH
ncbi:hypothetical protein WA538_000516 [Blastocystis sp. DL]